MNLASQLRKIRVDLKLSQEAFGNLGLISPPGWIKIENGQRQPSEALIEGLIKRLVTDKHFKATAAAALQEELLTLKYLEGSSPHVRKMAIAYAKSLPNGEALIVRTSPAKARRGRPPVAK